MYLGEKIHLFPHNGHGSLYLLPVSSDQLILFILQLLVEQVPLALQLLLFCIASVVQIVLCGVAVTAGSAPYRCPRAPVPAHPPAMVCSVLCPDCCTHLSSV